jgi:hypothetical protein
MIEAQDLALAGLTAQEAAQRPLTGRTSCQTPTSGDPPRLQKDGKLGNVLRGYDPSSGQFARRAAMR